MTVHDSALSALAARLAGTDASLTSSLRDILAAALQELIEAELTSTIGAAAGERTPERTAQRNGHRPKLLSTPAGDVEVGIPKLRTGSFFPELLESPAQPWGRLPLDASPTTRRGSGLALSRGHDLSCSGAVWSRPEQTFERQIYRLRLHRWPQTRQPDGAGNDRTGPAWVATVTATPGCAWPAQAIRARTRTT